MTMRVPYERWCTDADINRVCNGICGSGPDAPDPDLVNWAIDLASEVLYHLSGRRYPGIVPITLTACWKQTGCGACHRELTGWDLISSQTPIDWSGFYSVRRRLAPLSDGRCACSSTRCDQNIVAWPHYPARAVLAVSFDGVDQDVADFKIIDRWGIQRTTGCWPTDTPVEMTVAHGRPVTVGGRISAAEFACHWLRGHLGGDCALPESLTILYREEYTVESVTAADPAALRAGLTGLPYVDRWLNALAASRARPRALVLTPASPPSWQDRR